MEEHYSAIPATQLHVIKGTSASQMFNLKDCICKTEDCMTLNKQQQQLCLFLLPKWIHS